MNTAELKKFRTNLGLTQSEIASYLKTPYETYSSWERGKRRIPGIVEVALEAVRMKLKEDR